MVFNHVKKMLILIVAAGIVGLSFIAPTRSQGGSSDIVAILNQILQRVNNLPAALVSLGTYISNWTDPDTSEPTLQMQNNFQKLGSLLPVTQIAQSNMQPALNNFLFGNNGDNVLEFSGGGSPTGKMPPAKSFMYGNDLTYTSLLGQPLYEKDPRDKANFVMNYVMNASGANIWHQMPDSSFAGSRNAVIRYQAYYNTVMAATTLNNYILSAAAADKGQFNSLQQTLIQQATDPSTWFAKVSSENIGFVLRQLLMYQSQVFVLMTQMIQLQQQALNAQAVNTAVAIAGNQLNEASLVGYAKGKQPDFN